MWTVYIESNVEEDEDLEEKSKLKVKLIQLILSDFFRNPKLIITLTIPVFKKHCKNDFTVENLENIHFVNVYCLPAVREKCTLYLFADQSFDEPTLKRNFRNNDFNNDFLNNISCITPTFEPPDENHAATKTRVDSLSWNDTDRRDSFLVVKDHENGFKKEKLINLDGITLNGNPILDEEPLNNEYVDDTSRKRTILRCN